MANGQSGEEQGKPKEGGEMITLSRAELEKYVQRLNEVAKKRQQEAEDRADAKIKELEGKVKKTEERIKNVEEKPLRKWVDGFEEQAAEKFEDKVKSGALDNVIEARAAPIIAKKTVDFFNLVDGAHSRTFEDTIKRKQENKRRNRIRNRTLGIVGGVGLLAAMGLAGYALYDSNKRTTESAVGTANAAMANSNKALTELATHKSDYIKWQTTHDKTKKEDDEARAKATGELERKLTGEIGKKADKTELSSGIAGLKKDYNDLDAAIKAELAKNKGREEAYIKYKELADATKKDFDDFIKRYNEFEGKAATKEYADAEIGKIRKELADKIQPKIADYGRLITQLQNDSGANSEEARKLRRDYDELKKTYDGLVKRVVVIESERQKEKENPK